MPTKKSTPKKAAPKKTLAELDAERKEIFGKVMKARKAGKSCDALMTELKKVKDQISSMEALS